MRTNRTIISDQVANEEEQWPSSQRSDRVGTRPIVNRMTDACENIIFPCGR